MRAEFQERIDIYTAKLHAANPEDVPALSDEFNHWYDELSEDEKEEMRPFWIENTRQIREGLKKIRQQIESLVAMDEKEKRKKLRKISA